MCQQIGEMSSLIKLRGMDEVIGLFHFGKEDDAATGDAHVTIND